MIKNIRRLSEREEGFTLIELMIVMVVLGILAGIVIFAVGGFTEGADEKVLETNTKQCKTAQVAASANSAVAFESYFDDDDNDGTGDPPLADMNGNGTPAPCTATSTE